MLTPLLSPADTSWQQSKAQGLWALAVAAGPSWPAPSDVDSHQSFAGTRWRQLRRSQRLKRQMYPCRSLLFSQLCRPQGATALTETAPAVWMHCGLTLHNLLQALAGDSSGGESASEADEHEDAEARAERLGQRLRRQQARAGQSKAPAAGASSAGAAAKQRKQQGRKRKVGPLMN